MTTEQVKGNDGIVNGPVLEAVQRFAGNVENAAANVAGATKTAGKQVGSVATGEMGKLKAGLDDLIARLPSLSETDLNTAKEKLLEQIVIAKQAANQAASDAQEKVSQGIEAAGGLVKSRPLQSIAIATGVGLLIGLLISRDR
jgi:ElaB/YqjD/DUF883 family membrane-anchored ribosome-binding protein